MKALRTLFRWFLWSTLLLLMLPLLFGALLMTEPGTGWLLRQTPDLLRPLGVDLQLAESRGSLFKRLELIDLQLTFGENRLEARQLLLRWRPLALTERRLHIDELRLADVQLRLPPGEQSDSAPALPDIVLPLKFRLDRFELERMQIEQGDSQYSITETTLAASYDGQQLALADLSYTGDGIVLDGGLTMQASAPHDLQAELAIQIDASVVGEEVGGVKAKVMLSGAALRPKLDLKLNEPQVIRVHGGLQLDQAQPVFDLVAEWSQLSWPMQGEAQYAADKGRLLLRGVADAYRLELRALLSGEGIPAAGIDLVAEGDLNQLRLTPLKSELLGGRLRAEGTIGWQQGVNWDLQVNAEAIDPGLYVADWPGQIGGDLSISGSYEEQLALQVQVRRLSGALRGQPVDAKGGLAYRAGMLQADNLELASGPNHLYLNGRAEQQLDLSFTIDAPELASLYPGLAGRLQGSGQLGGAPQTPTITAELTGAALGYQDILAKKIELKANWQQSGGQGDLQISGIDLQGNMINDLRLKIDGTPGAHRLDLSLAAADKNAKFSARGGLIDQSWKGELTSLNLQQQDLGEWLLKAPVRLQLSETRVQAEDLCLVQDVTALCAKGGWSSDAGFDLVGGLRKFDLARLAELIPGEAVIKGELQGDFKLTGTPERPSLIFRLDPGSGSIQLPEHVEDFELSYRNAGINGRFEDDRGRADIQFDLGSKGRAKGSLQLGPEERGTRSLRGLINVDFPDLALLAGFVPMLEQVEGRLHTEANLAGTLTNPEISGVLQIENARALLPAVGITLADIDLSIRGDGSRPLQVQGQVQSGKGRITIDGSVDVASGPAVDLRLKGESFEAVRLPEALVEVSPDLRLYGSAPYQLTGTLRIPKTAIELKELPSGTVEVSDDEIIIGQETTQEYQPTAQNVTADVRVVLGEDVTFKGFGLKTGLTGAVETRVDAAGTSVNGKIELRDGSYKSYGQDLTVERGRLLFAGPPANPSVDLRAVRLSYDEQVKAYLAVSGTLSKPRLRVYSEPSLPDTEALAYLLTGRGLKSADRGEGLNIAAAALSMGVSKGEPLLQQLSDRLGLDDLRVEGGDSGIEDSSLVVGKYLDPNLYVGYSQGLFNPEGAVLLRLRLSERLEVESRSGNEQSVDLFYRFEHD